MWGMRGLGFVFQRRSFRTRTSVQLQNPAKIEGHHRYMRRPQRLGLPGFYDAKRERVQLRFPSAEHAPGRGVMPNYLTVTFAPAASKAAFALSAVSLFAFSKTVDGAPSTRSFASLRPRPVKVRTSLMTAIF